MIAHQALLSLAFGFIQAETVVVWFHVAPPVGCETGQSHKIRFLQSDSFSYFGAPVKVNSWYEFDAPAGSRSVEVDAVGTDAVCFDQILFDGVPVTAGLPRIIDRPCEGIRPEYGYPCSNSYVWELPATVTTTATTTATTTTTTISTESSASTTNRTPLISFLATMPMPTLNVTSDRHGVVQMQWSAPPLPREVLFDDMELAYSADISVTHDGLSPSSDCGALWNDLGPGPAVSLFYEQLSGPCTLKVNEDGKSIRRLGFVALFLESVNGSDVQVLRTFIRPVELKFPAEVVASSRQFAVWANTTFGLQTFELLPFAAALTLYKSSRFAEPVVVPSFQEGQEVFVEIRIEIRILAQLSLALKLHSAWLSSSDNATDTGAVLVNLTDLNSLKSPQGSARFYFSTVACETCVLHVLSIVTVQPGRNLRSEEASSATVWPGRNLEGVRHAFSLASVAIQVRANDEAADGSQALKGSATGMVLFLAAASVACTRP